MLHAVSVEFDITLNPTISVPPWLPTADATRGIKWYFGNPGAFQACTPCPRSSCNIVSEPLSSPLAWLALLGACLRLLRPTRALVTSPRTRRVAPTTAHAGGRRRRADGLRMVEDTNPPAFYMRGSWKRLVLFRRVVVFSRSLY